MVSLTSSKRLPTLVPTLSLPSTSLATTWTTLEPPPPSRESRFSSDRPTSLTVPNPSRSAPAGVNYYNSYLRAVYAAMQKRKMKNALMISDAFMGAS